MNDLLCEDSMKLEDWLRLLDFDVMPVIYGRYKSRPFCPEYLIITSLEFNDFLNAIRNQSASTMNQWTNCYWSFSWKNGYVTHDDAIATDD